MKKFLFILSLIFFLTSCKKLNIKENNHENDNCNTLTTISGWSLIDFKRNYKIQVPAGFEGVGMTGFEGNIFYKNAPDNKIILHYAYCNSLFCNDFGDTLPNMVPGNIKVMDNFDYPITLDKIEYFCQNSQPTGVLYYSDDSIATGRLYWKENNIFKQALEIEFHLSELGTVKQIIETIKPQIGLN